MCPNTSWIINYLGDAVLKACGLQSQMQTKQPGTNGLWKGLQRETSCIELSRHIPLAGLSDSIAGESPRDKVDTSNSNCVVASHSGQRGSATNTRTSKHLGCQRETLQVTCISWVKQSSCDNDTTPWVSTVLTGLISKKRGTPLSAVASSQSPSGLTGAAWWARWSKGV